MLRIGQVEATATQDGKYTDGSVAGGIAATRLRAAAFNAMQEELAHIVESAGLALDINDMTQVLKAIQKLTLSRANPFADIKSDGAAAISTALTNLQLGEAAKRNVDAGIIDGIPDMSSFRSLMIGNGYVRIPTIGGGGGAQALIIQWGVHSTAPGSNAAYNLNIAFPTGILWATGGRGAPGSNAPMNVGPEGTQQIRIQNYAPGGVNENCFWLAIGY
ncbi:TPA: hypothetical protein ACPFQA_001854 [Citrobacter braakii]